MGRAGRVEWLGRPGGGQGGAGSGDVHIARKGVCIVGVKNTLRSVGLQLSREKRGGCRKKVGGVGKKSMV